jgi:hypothetical protein
MKIGGGRDVLFRVFLTSGLAGGSSVSRANRFNGRKRPDQSLVTRLDGSQKVARRCREEATKTDMNKTGREGVPEFN